MAPTSEASVVVEPASPVVAPQPALRLVLVFLGHLAPIPAAGLIYESLRGVFQYRSTVHVGDLHALEAELFSITTAQGPQALSDLVSRHTSPWLDVLCGVTYLVFLAEVVLVTALLFYRARPKALELSIAFLVVNLIGWAIWMVYPAAPPWYVDQYGTGPARLDAVSSAAGLERMDALLGLPLATTFYAKSANVFGAVPSLHVAYATLVAWTTSSVRGALRWVTIAYALSMAFSAVYLRHHYILDVIAGAALAWVVGVATRALLPLSSKRSGERA